MILATATTEAAVNASSNGFPVVGFGLFFVGVVIAAFVMTQSSCPRTY